MNKYDFLVIGVYGEKTNVSVEAPDYKTAKEYFKKNPHYYGVDFEIDEIELKF